MHIAILLANSSGKAFLIYLDMHSGRFRSVFAQALEKHGPQMSVLQDFVGGLGDG